MSTTVTYKGSALTTVNNQTRILKTAGKYMEDNVTLVDVSGSSVNNQDKTVTPTTSQQSISADSGYTGLGIVTINAIPSQYIVPSGNLAITANGTGIDVTQYTTVSVNVPTGSSINNQNKTVTPTKSQQSISADSGYTGLGTVTVKAIPSQYIIPSGILSITSNGTLDVTNYASVAVNVAGLDIPVFTSDNEATTISCNKTYAECYALLQNSDYRALLNTPEMQAALMGHAVAETTETLEYYYMSDGIPWARIQYSSDNSINIVQLNFEQHLVITTNGTYTPDGDYMWSRVEVNVPTGSTINNQDKTVNPSESQQTITADSGYTGLGTVTVNAISSTYVGSDIVARDGDDLTASGATVSVPAGYYSAAASKSVASGTVTAPPTIRGTAASVSTGSGTLTLTKTIWVTPTVITAGYITAGTAGNSSVSLTANVTIDPMPTASGATVTIPAGYYTEQTTKSVSSGSASGPTSLSGSSATVTTGTNTLTLTKTGVTTTPTVSAGYVSSATASTATVTLTASVTTKAAATYYATTSDQTISASQYLTGAQTIKALSQTNLSAANIKAGTTISVSNGNTNVWSVAGTYTSDATAVAADIVDGETAYVNGSKVTGTLTIQDVYVRSTAPTASVGNDGDIYIQA